MKPKNLLYPICILLVTLTLVTNCANDGKTTYESGNFLIKYYKTYRFLANKVITFQDKDELTKEKAHNEIIFYKTFYTENKKIAKYEFYKKKLINKRYIFDKDGNLIRLETFKDGKLFEYYVNFYDEEDASILLKREVSNYKNQLLRVEKFGFGQLEEIDIYNPEGQLIKTEVYAANKIDVIKYYDEKGNLIREQGTYDNGKYKYSLKYYYDRNNKLLAVEHYQKGSLVKKHYYNENGKYSKEEHYLGKNNLIKTVNFDSEGNPVKDSLSRK
ncbi:MAG: hypothetical protein OEV44_06235 [Spirochaetota bacterium]|nr:hypothetical protein [Spirochaetota bacterium]